MDSALAFRAAAPPPGGRVEAGEIPGDRKAVDLSHHLSELAKARRFSPLKSFSRYMGIPGIISLAGGLPDPSYFPFESMSGALQSQETFDTDHHDKKKRNKSAGGWLSSWFGGSPSKPTVQQITVPKFVSSPTPESLQLSGAFQYGAATGLVFLNNFLREWTSLVSPPAYTDWEVLLDDGSTDGWHKVVELLCNKGDPVLVEAWTYPSAIESGWAMDVRPVPVAIDADGLIPEALDKVLSEWDEKARGCRKPRLLYTVPVGQNPTGSIITVERRRKVYSVCVKHDVIICEDDPYYILQFPYDKSGATVQSDPVTEENRRFVRSLSPSYLTFDYEGRVIRLDTFSKTIAPGSRLGWITSNARFSERLLRASEVSTQQPSGFSQVMVSKILETWGMDGWVRWLRGLRHEYRLRRDVVIDALQEGFKVETVRAGKQVGAAKTIKMVGYAKYNSAKRTPVRTLDLDEKFASFGLSEGRPPLVDFAPPEAGMFVWVNVHLHNHKSFRSSASPEDRKERTRTLMNDLWEAMAQKKLLVAPGWMFAGDGLRTGAPAEKVAAAVVEMEDRLAADEQLRITNDEEQGIGHFRIAFSFSTHDTLRAGIRIFSQTVTEFFE